MARDNTALIAGGVLIAFIIGVLIGRAMTPGGGDPNAPNSQPVVAAEPRAPGAQPRLPFQTARAADAERPAPEAVEGFAFRRLILETSGERPRACLQFSAELRDNGEVDYGDYVRLSPATGFAAAAEGSSLCLTGLDFDTDYRATLRAGLPGAGGAALERAEEVAIAFGDKPAYVGFSGDGVILPRAEADGLGIETVNVEAVSIAVYRVSDRAIALKSIVAGDAAGEDRYAYVYGREDGADLGAKIFERRLETPGARNETATTVFPLGAALASLDPGAYFIRLEDASPSADDTRRRAEAWRWIVYTDMALTSFSGADGLDVFVRSLSTARPVAGVELALVARNNDILGEAVTSAEGRARFDGALVNGGGALRPQMILAYGPQSDFAALDLTRAPLDLSDRDVAGRDAPSRLDAYLYLDRGIYRPSETAHITGLLRDGAGRAVSDRPLTVVIRRPNYTEAETRRIDALDIGAFSFDFETPAAAARGVWRIEVKADGIDRVIGEASFSVEDFVPQRLEVVVDAEEGAPIRPGETREVSVESRFLYGAPASGLPVEAEARLRVDSNPFTDYADFRFGPVEGAFDERFLKLANTTTDESGAASLTLDVSSAPRGFGAPLRADLVVAVIEPGGRPVRESARIPVRPDDRYIGLRLADEKQNFAIGEAATIETALVDWRGEAVAGELEWRLVEEDYRFDWYRENGEWKWRRAYQDILVAEGRAAAPAEGPARLVGRELDPGAYRLRVAEAGGGAISEIRFYVGWRSYAAGADTPDEASLTLMNDMVAPGGRARLFLDPPYEGEALIAVATDRVHEVQRVRVGPEGREITINTKPEWGAGFYVLATVVTPRDPGDQPVPRRAMGVAHVPFEMAERKLRVELDLPERVRPRQTVEIPVELDGARPGAAIRMTLAAVDEGILRLTKFASPDPVDYYYGKKRLGVEVRDDYGRILNANLGAPARFGGDQIGGEGLTVVPTKSVALFSGVIEIDRNGKALIPVTIPDFNGELRIMAVAWTAEKLGNAAGALTVRDAVPAELTLSRFLAPGDRASATLLIDNVEGAPGDYQVSIAGDGPISISGERTFALEQGERRTALFDLTAGAEGIAAVNLDVTGPDGFRVARSYPIEVRTPYFPTTEVRTEPLGPGETFLLTRAVAAPYAEGSTELAVSFSRLRGLEPGAILDSLYRYPYGCTEQLTSSATPLLYVNVLGGEAGRGPDRAVRPRVQKAVNAILNRQSSDGSFGLWRVGDRYANPWLAPYVADFLYRADAEGYAVPGDAMARAYKSLRGIARLDGWRPVGYQRVVDDENANDRAEFLHRRAAAYAIYVLARAGRGDLSDARYFHDALLDDTPSPLARAHLGAALAMMGDRARSVSAFEKAREALGWSNTGDYYQSPLRDAAGVVALAVEAGRTDELEALTDAFLSVMKDPTDMNTQEKAFVLIAAQALLRDGGPVALEINGEAREGLAPAPSFSPDVETIGEGVPYRNIGDGEIYRTLTVTGAPLAPPEPAAEGFEMEKRLMRRDGTPADLAALSQNDRIVVVLSGRASDQRLHPAVIADLLPAGFEIETVLGPEDGGGEARGPYRWIGEIDRTRIAEARDDRFVAAIDLDNGERFTIAYIVRAVTPGDFAAPGAVIEDMYRPGLFARTAHQRLSIAPAR